MGYESIKNKPYKLFGLCKNCKIQQNLYPMLHEYEIIT